ncbi:MAG: tetratricopeptide repeat protein [Terriglobia bacterium]
MEITLSNRPSRIATQLLATAAFLLATAWITKAYLATRLGGAPTLPGLRYAIRLDPTQSLYHLELGRLLQYNPAVVDPEQSVVELKQAVRLSPYDPEVWRSLAVALQFEGRTEESLACLRRADTLAPRLPALQWDVANAFLLHGQVAEAFRHFKVVLAGSDRYNVILFNTVWEASHDASQILAQVIPESVPVELSYLDYLARRAQFDDARSVWERIVASPDRFAPAQAAAYLDKLITAHRPAEAWQVWEDLRSRGAIGELEHPTDQNLMINGDFEQEALNLGFSWRIVPAPGTYAGIDSTHHHSASHSLLVQFSGKDNINYENAFQFVRVSPGSSYRLSAFLRTQGITTDSGPRLMVRDAYDPQALAKVSDDLEGSSEGWTQVILDFKTGPRTELLVVGLARLPSRKLDNQIAGRVWLDDVNLAPLP